jgi:hypothetical protein
MRDIGIAFPMIWYDNIILAYAIYYLCTNLKYPNLTNFWVKERPLLNKIAQYKDKTNNKAQNIL